MGTVENGRLHIRVTLDMQIRLRELFPDGWWYLWRDAIRIDQTTSPTIDLYFEPLRPEDV